MNKPMPGDKSHTAFRRLLTEFGGNQSDLANQLGTSAANVTRWAKYGLPRSWAEHASLHMGHKYEPSDYQ